MHDGSGLKVPQRMVIRDRNGNENGYQHGERPNMGLIIGLKPNRCRPEEAFMACVIAPGLDGRRRGTKQNAPQKPHRNGRAKKQKGLA